MLAIGSSFLNMGKRKFCHGLPLISLSAINGGAKPCGDAQMSPNTAGQTGVPESVKSAPRTPSNVPWVADRKDAPICNFTRKARRPSESEWTDAQRMEALTALRRDYTASSARGPAAAVLRTWDAMHRRMMGTNLPVYPLTPEKIANVAAAFKACGYRSFSNYMSKAKEKHIDMYGEWGVDLAMESKRACRSVTSGIGPVSQRTPIEFEKIIAARSGYISDSEPLTEGGPLGPHNLVVIGTFFMLREIEASLLLAANVKMNRDDFSVTLRLPSSKTDPSAASVERTWGCLCRSSGINGCPFHSAKAQMEYLDEFFPAPARPLDLPFFPTETGETVEKVKVVETLEALHTHLGLSIVDEDGNRLLGGHSMRLAGARVLSASGMHLYQVELMARWKSPMLLHYAQTAPLTKITQDFEQAREEEKLSAKLDSIRKQMDELSRCNQADTSSSNMEPRVSKLENDITALDSRTQQMIRDEISQVRKSWSLKPAEYVMNNSSRTWHVVHTDGIAHHPETWSTKCGWKFAFSKFTRIVELPSTDIRKCDKCWPCESDSSSSESTSESEA